jgi:type III pantothenate kinase
MNLVIDVGNTRTKVGIFSADEPVKQLSVSGFSMNEIIPELSCFNIEKCIFSSVVDGLFMADELKNRFPVMVLNDQTPLPFKNKYKTPLTLGNDRIANIAGAVKLFPDKNVLVIDAGTCLKTDFLNSDKEYSGGSISPGLQMRFNALHHFTSRLPLVNYRSFEKYTGTTTEESILAGVRGGYLMEIEGFIEKYRRDFGDLKAILTGGDSPLFDKTLKNSIFVVPYLSLTGLNEILKYNVEKNKV